MQQPALILVLGDRVAQPIMVLSVVSALIFTAGAIRYAYKLLKAHILNG